MVGTFTGQINVAQKLIDKFGQTLIICRVTDAARVDPADPGILGTPTITDFTVTGVFVGFELQQINGTTIQRGDQLVLVAAKNLTIEPTSKDTIVRDGEKWEIVSVEKVDPNGEKILFKLQVRQ